MAHYRYPSEIQSTDAPWILFSTQRPAYNPSSPVISGNKWKLGAGRDSVAMYLPSGFTINDSLAYDTADGGLAESLGEATINKLAEGKLDITAPEIGELVQKVGGRVAARFGAKVADIGISGNVEALYDRFRGRVPNPREFMLFKSPGLRTFSFTFEMVPNSANEALEIPKIIKFFRSAAYPQVSKYKFDYIFPDSFSISIGQSSTLIKIPEVACTGINVTYNPNTMSYYRVENMPVQTNLQVDFQELKAIDRDLVEQGF